MRRRGGHERVGIYINSISQTVQIDVPEIIMLAGQWKEMKEV